LSGFVNFNFQALSKPGLIIWLFPFIASVFTIQRGSQQTFVRSYIQFFLQVVASYTNNTAFGFVNFQVFEI
jgi:hypothetical protein